MKKSILVYEADHVNNVLYIEKQSLQRAGKITNPEFTELMKIKKVLPGYAIQTKDFPKKEKKTYGGLKISVMQAFIIQYEDTTEKAEASLRELNKARAEGLLKNAAYSAAKSWFLGKYGDAYNNSALSKTDGKRDALIKELLATVDERIINPITEIQKEGVA